MSKTIGFPEELKAWRQKQGLTQAEAAELFQLTETGYANWEVGRKAPRGLTRTKVLEVIQEPQSGDVYRELARFTFPLGDHVATLVVRGKRLAPEDFDRLKAAVGRLQELGRRGSSPQKPVTAKKRHATPGRKRRLGAGDEGGKSKQAS
jgi:transcriptional regulator with XRE-family HTH domain